MVLDHFSFLFIAAFFLTIAVCIARIAVAFARIAVACHGSGGNALDFEVQSCFWRPKTKLDIVIFILLGVFNFRVFPRRAKNFRAFYVFAKAYSTRRFSRAVPHHGTCRALTGLTSEFRWDRVYS